MSRLIYSLDLETTGLEWEWCQVLEIALIAWDLDKKLPLSEMPRFRCLVKHDRIMGDPYALSMHSGLLRLIANDGFERRPGQDPVRIVDVFKPEAVIENVRDWADSVNGHDEQGRVKMQFAGKNAAGFDLQFMRLLPLWKKLIRPVHRTFDPADLYFLPDVDPVKPDMNTCCQRAGLLESRKEPSVLLPGQGSVSLTTKHDATGDAEIVIKLLAHKWGIPV